MTLQGKTIVITGAAQGLGRVLATKLASEKATVVLIDKEAGLLQELGKSISSKSYVCDLRSRQQIAETVEAISKTFPKVDIVINNAGVWTEDSLEKDKPELREEALAVNALGNIEFTEAMLPLLKKQNGGYLFNVISTAAVGDIQAGDSRDWKVYGASKWAFRGYIHSLKKSLEKTNIKVTEFYPGGFESNLYENAQRPEPHNRPWMMRTEDVADIIIFALTRPSDVLMERIVVTRRMQNG